MSDDGKKDSGKQYDECFGRRNDHIKHERDGWGDFGDGKGRVEEIGRGTMPKSPKPESDDP